MCCISTQFRQLHWMTSLRFQVLSAHNQENSHGHKTKKSTTPELGILMVSRIFYMITSTCFNKSLHQKNRLFCIHQHLKSTPPEDDTVVTKCNAYQSCDYIGYWTAWYWRLWYVQSITHLGQKYCQHSNYLVQTKKYVTARDSTCYSPWRMTATHSILMQMSLCLKHRTTWFQKSQR
jgi:hypothetical protein